MSVSTNQRQSVSAGYCGDGSSVDQPCVLERSDCAADQTERWRSSRQMVGAPYSGHGGYCLWKATVRDMMSQRDFGACVDATSGDVRCAWSAADCNASTETWSFPHADCECEDVRVGGCVAVSNGQVFCVVSPDGCDQDTDWMDWQSLSTETTTDCYLCVAVTDPIANQTPATQPVDDSSSDSSMVVTIVATLGAVVLVGLALVGAYVAIRKRKASAVKEENKPTVSVQMITEPDDTVSNLDEEDFVLTQGVDAVVS